MDEQMLSRLMGTYGAPVNARNANIAREFFAANPDVAERRAMGMRGSGNEDNSDVLGPMLDRMIAETTGPAPAPAQVEQQPLPTVQNASAPTRKSATAAPRQASMQPAHREAGFQEANAAPQGGGSGSSGWMNDLLLSILGASSVAGRTMMGGGNTPPTGNAPQKALPRAIGNDGALLENPYPDGQKRLTYQPKLEDNVSDLSRVPTNEPPTTKVEGDKGLTGEARKKQLQAEIDAENQSAASVRDEMEKRARDRANTRKLSDAAKRAVGRK
jgi:hypothetical protein